MNKTISIVIGAIIVIIVAIIVIAQRPSGGSTYESPAPSASTSPSETATSTVGVATSTPAYTLADVAKHNSRASCWTTIKGNVYDLTNWISQHPGGEGAILSICGKDGTSAFMGQHSGDTRPQQILATFKIGVLK